MPRQPKELKKDFIRTITNADPHRRISDKFNDWLELIFCATSKPFYISIGDQVRADKREAQYMQVVERTRDKSFIREVCPKLLALTVEALETHGHDFLGEVSSELEVLNPGSGQFFTPYPVSKMLAKMTFESTDNPIDERGYVTASEPACGAGGMVLALADVMLENGFNPTEHLFVSAVDVSRTAYHMAFIQLNLRAIPANVVWGNTLTMEVYDHAWTIGTVWFNIHHPSFLSDRNDRTRSDNPTSIITDPDYTLRTNQLSLFGE